MLKVKNKASNAIDSGKPHAPTADQLDYGEIAINYAKGYETLFFKNDNGEIISYSGGGGEFPENYIDDVKYDSEGKKIVFYKGDVEICNIDASDFVKDGMVDNVTYENGKLAITFNEDSGKDPIELHIGDVFNSENFYTKSEIDKKLADIAAGGEIDLDGYATKEWVEENYPKVKFFETVNEYEDGEYSDDDIVLVNEVKTIIYQGNPFRAFSFRVIEGDEDNMRIVVWKKEESTFEFIKDYDLLDKETMVPIGVEVVPENHDRYGDGSAGVMSLVGMSFETPDTGKLGDFETNQDNTNKDSAMYWGAKTGHGLSYNNKFPTLGASNGSVADKIQSTTCENHSILPSDRWTNGKQCLTDKTTYYYNSNDANRYFAPSPYDGKNANPLYIYDTGANPYRDFNGKSNTATIISKATSQANWKTDATITNSSASGYFPMACCCWRFHTEGTNQGDWHLPSMGELGYLAPRYNKINVAINKINEVFGTCADILLPGASRPQNLMSSTLIKEGSVARLSIMNCTAGTTSPDSSREYARAFIKIKP